MDTDDLIQITNREITEQLEDRRKPITKKDSYLEGRGSIWDIMRDGDRLLEEYRIKQLNKNRRKKEKK